MKHSRYLLTMLLIAFLCACTSEGEQEAAKPEVMIRMKSDAIIFPCWYYDELSADILDTRDKMLADGVDYDLVVKSIKEEFCELTEQQIDEILSEK